ncbi:MAG: hypothetical protein AAF483_26980, partial [Planctomycetota bacterium]
MFTSDRSFPTFVHGLSTLVLVGACLLGAVANGQSDYIGVAIELGNPAFAQRLGLTEEQQTQVRELISKRRGGALDLAKELRDLPPEERPARLEAYRSETEQMAFAMLDDSQKEMLEKVRIDRMGLISLAEPAIAEQLKLADWQKEKVASWKSKVAAAGKSTLTKTRKDAEQSIRMQLSDSQFGMWQFLAGSGEKPDEVIVPEPASSKVAGMPTDAVDNSRMPVEDIRLQILFRGAPFDEVIDWLAKQADLALDSNIIPPGTFNYEDRSRTYTVAETMDRINESLLSSGFQLIRSNRVLRCYDLDAIPDELDRGVFLREIAPVVSPEQLSKYGDFEPVTCTFSLKRLDPETVKGDVEQMLSVLGRVDSFPSTGDLMVTDVAKKLRAIYGMISRAEESGGSTLQAITLKHVTAEEVLLAARPHLGLEEESNSNDEISISTTLFGDQIFARGQAEKVQVLRDVVEKLDVSMTDDESQVDKVEVPEIRKHKVGVMDLQLAYEITSQLLAGAPEVRLARDDNAKQLILQARPSEHEIIEKMLGNVAEDPDIKFDVIQLKSLDVQLAIAAIEKFYPEDEEGLTDAPVIDGDILAGQVWVKGTNAQVKQITDFLNNLEAIQPKPLWGDKVSQIPLTGRAADRALQQAQQMWNVTGGKNRIRVIESDGEASKSGLQQRMFAPNKSDKEAFNLRKLNAMPLYGRNDIRNNWQPTNSSSKSGRFVMFAQEGEKEAGDGDNADANDDSDNSGEEKILDSDIVIMRGPNGLIISSEDAEAAARFREMLTTLAIPSGSGEPTIVYLKNIKSDACKEL